MFRRHLIALAVLAVSGTALAQSKEIKIAHIYSKTGPLEAYGKQTQTGLMMGLEYATGGTMQVAGRKIVVIEKDDQGKPDLGKNLLAAAYGDDKVDLAVGPTASPVALAMLPVAEEYKKILLVEPAVADSITGDKWNKYIFRTGRNSSQDAISNAVALDKPGVTIATLAQDYAFGRDGVKAFKESVKKAKIVHEEYLPVGTTDFTAGLQRIIDKLKDQPGKKYISVGWSGSPTPFGKIADMDLKKRYGIELASGGNDNLLMIWDAANDRPTHRITAHQAAVKALAWCPFQANLLATGGGTADRTIKFHNTHTGAGRVVAWEALFGQLRASSRHAESSLGSGWCGAALSLPTLPHLPQGPSSTPLTPAAKSARCSGTVMSASCSPPTASGALDGVAGGMRALGCALGAAAGGCSPHMPPLTASPPPLPYHPSSLPCSQNQLCLWKYPSMAKVAELTGHTSRVLHLAQSPDGTTVVSAAADETLRFWRSFGEPAGTGAAKPGATKAAAASSMMRSVNIR